MQLAELVRKDAKSLDIRKMRFLNGATQEVAPGERLSLGELEEHPEMALPPSPKRCSEAYAKFGEPAICFAIKDGSAMLEAVLDA